MMFNWGNVPKLWVPQMQGVFGPMIFSQRTNHAKTDPFHEVPQHFGKFPPTVRTSSKHPNAEMLDGTKSNPVRARQTLIPACSDDFHSFARATPPTQPAPDMDVVQHADANPKDLEQISGFDMAVRQDGYSYRLDDMLCNVLGVVQKNWVNHQILQKKCNGFRIVSYRNILQEY